MKTEQWYLICADVSESWPRWTLDRKGAARWWEAIFHRDEFTEGHVRAAVQRLLVGGTKSTAGPTCDEIVNACWDLWEEESQRVPQRPALPLATGDPAYRQRWGVVHRRIVAAGPKDPVKRLFYEMRGVPTELKSVDAYSLLEAMEHAIRQNPTPVPRGPSIFATLNGTTPEGET